MTPIEIHEAELLLQEIEAEEAAIASLNDRECMLDIVMRSPASFKFPGERRCSWGLSAESDKFADFVAPLTRMIEASKALKIARLTELGVTPNTKEDVRVAEETTDAQQET